MAGAKENLWRDAWRSFWRDPANVIAFFLSAGFMRRVVALLWLAVVLFVLTRNSLPTQQESWALWFPPEKRQLAFDTAAGVTYGSFLIVMMVLPAYKAGHKVIGHVGTAVAALLLFFSLIGAFNYYAHSNAITSGAANTETAVTAATKAEADKALADFEARTAASLKVLDDQIAKVPANYPTGMSRLVRQRTAADDAAKIERIRLEAAVAAARMQTVVVATTKVDTRPVDGVIAELSGVDRRLVSNFTDLMRSATFELLIIIGAPLSAVAIVASFAGDGPVKIPEVPKPPTSETPPGTVPLKRKRLNQTKLRPPTAEEIAAWERELAGLPPAEPPADPPVEPPIEPPVGPPVEPPVTAGAE